MIKKNTYNSIIDTMEIEIPLGNMSGEWDIEKIREYSFIKEARTKIDVNGECFAIMVVNLNKIRGHYARIESLGEYKNTFNEVLGILEVIDKEMVELNRLDVAIDSKKDFHNNFKYFLYLFELMAYSDKRADKWYTTNLNTLKNNTIKQIGRSLEVSFYDKEDESNSRHLYNARMEFRFKRLNKMCFEDNVQKVLDMLKVVESNVEPLNKNMTIRLCRLYDMEMKENSVRSLSEFVRKFDRYIYTIEIMKGLYEHSDLKGNCTNWIRNFKRTNSVDFYTNKDIKAYKVDCNKAIREYKNN